MDSLLLEFVAARSRPHLLDLVLLICSAGMVWPDHVLNALAEAFRFTAKQWHLILIECILLLTAVDYTFWMLEIKLRHFFWQLGPIYGVFFILLRMFLSLVKSLDNADED